MPIQTIEPRRLYRQIADQLRGLVERGEYAAGSRLLPERDLALQLGVSRPSVREALIALEVEGLVEVRMGSGVYVRHGASAVTRARPAGGEGPLETLRARAVVERELAAHAAGHMSKAQIAGLRNALALMRQEAAAGHAPARGDRLFHIRIAEASENSVLQRMVGELFDERRSALFARLGSHFENAHSWACAMTEHAAVIEAIASRSPEAARAAMHAHLSNAHDRFTASIALPAQASAARRRRPARKAA